MDLELDKIFDELELELERLEFEKGAIEIDLTRLYNNPNTTWDYKILWKIFDLLIQALFPNNDIERFELATDTPPDQYHVVLRDLVEKLKNCKHIVIVREYDTLYYCVE